MINTELNLANSTLKVKASGNIDEEAIKEINLPQGKSIAELLYEEKNKKETRHPAQ